MNLVRSATTIIIPALFSGYTFGTGEPIVKGGFVMIALKVFWQGCTCHWFRHYLPTSFSRYPDKDRNNNRQRLSAFALSKKASRSHLKKAQELRKTDFDRIVSVWMRPRAKEDYQAYADRTGMTKITYMDGE